MSKEDSLETSWAEAERAAWDNGCPQAGVGGVHETASGEACIHCGARQPLGPELEDCLREAAKKQLPPA